ncbi:hypothetical protein AB1L30_00270, partial [Bremerella sp. JC817]|uniref:hypothetical protein n=1 Tax=Bremerella sp. JC817 TaxID=3231756 RepID=UPI00345A0958
VLDNDVDSALLDLQLLGLMQQQSIDARVEDSMDFAEIEAFRYLVFQPATLAAICSGDCCEIAR